jgi:membrane-associated phospholipid phosphatase
MQLRRISTPGLWFLAALALLVLFGIYTVIFSTGALLFPNLHVEQWLLHRPLTSIDCVFFEWKQFGEVGFSLLLTLVLGITCLFLGYRRRALPYLLLLLLLGAGVEYVGKQIFPQVIPVNTQVGINSLACPQIWSQPDSVKIMVALGMWWEAPPVRPKRVAYEQYSATAPLIFDESATIDYGYPSGHAIRWCFIGLVACWLAWRHVKSRRLRAFLMALALLVAFGGGFAQFYIGLHLATDLIAGYLFGASSACCAIGLLLLNASRNKKRSASALGPSDTLVKKSVSV